MKQILQFTGCMWLGIATAMADEVLQAELQTVIDRMSEIYMEDPNGSRQIFDELWLQDENVVYMSEQFLDVFYGRDAVASYWKPSWDTLYGYRELYSDLRAVYLTPEIAMATLAVRYDMHAVTRTPLAGWSRLALMFRKTDGGWKIQQFYEAPMSLISQGRRLHEEALDPDFATHARAQNPRYDELVGGDENIQLRRYGVPWVPRPQFRPQSTPAEDTEEGSE